VELKLLELVKIHPVVNVSRVCRYKEQIAGQKVVLPPPVIIKGEEEYEVERILSKRRRYRKVEYLVHWKGYTVERDTWEKVENLGNVQEVLRDYERGYKDRQEGSGKKKMAFTTEVSCWKDIQLNCCMDGMIGGLRRSIWRNWREAEKNRKAANSSGGKILKGKVMS